MPSSAILARQLLQERRARAPRQVSVLRLFLASPGDVAAEREAVERAVADYNASSDDLHVEVVRWENRAAPDDRRPQDVVFDSTGFFTDIDLFVGIFWSRLGTRTLDLATGQEYPGGSVEELVAARELERAGQIKRIMLYFCERPVAPLDARSAENLRAVAQLRERIQQGTDLLTGAALSPPQQGLYGSYQDIKDFQLIFQRDLRIAVREATPPRTPGRDLGPLVHKLCDRVRQEDEFHPFLVQGLRRSPGQPQACLLFGGEDEAPDHFVERLVQLRVTRCAESILPQGRTVVTSRSVDWPEGDELRDLKRHLPAALLRVLDDEFAAPDPTAAALVGLPLFRRSGMVVLHHDIYLSRWSATMGRLIAWYLDEFWSGLPPDSGRAEILIFLNLICCRPGMVGPGSEAALKAMRRDLKRAAASDIGCRRVLLPELEPVTRADVMRWLAEHAREDSIERRQRLAEEIFCDPATGKPLEKRPMSEIEDALREILDRFGADAPGPALPDRGW